MRKMLKKFRSEEGFDLVQILVAVAILAAVAVVAVLLLLGQVRKGENAATKANVSNAITAAKIYAAEQMDVNAVTWSWSAVTYIRKELGNPPDLNVFVAPTSDATITSLNPSFAVGDLVIRVDKGVAGPDSANAADGGAVITPEGVVTRSGAAE